jgi:plasmid stabilization system protein ParE
MTNYYKKQLEKIDTKNEYAPTILIQDANGNKTKYLNLNQESARVLIEWLQENFKQEQKREYETSLENKVSRLQDMMNKGKNGQNIARLARLIAQQAEHLEARGY